MNRDTWRRAKEWLLEAAALPESERAAYLERRCPDESVRRELLEMLASEAALSGIVDTSTLMPGTRLGPYEIDTVIGAGGMGEVYRARDSRLGRDVAIKVLPALFATDRDRLARFEREAKLLASLNHPHICTLFDVGREASTDYIVMECVEGELLSDRLRKAPLAVDKALVYAIEIADALDKAHAVGIVHRDLKPGNVMLTKSGTKLLDFGLARSTRAPSHDVTKTGTILGTLRYMAPEQLKGAEADARSDVWAFGCVLYQMLSGRPPFDSESEVAIGAAILEAEPPPLSTTARGVSPQLLRVIDRCLAKSPDDRWQSAADLRHELEWIARSGDPSQRVEAGTRSRSTNRERVAWIVAAAALGATIATASYVAWRARPIPPTPVTQASILVPDGIEARSLALSGDGRLLAYVGRPKDGGTPLIWVRSMGEVEARQLIGTAGAHFPFWSRDLRSIGFFADGKLKRIDVATGLVKTLCNAPQPRGGTWAEHTILFVPDPHSGLYRVPDDREGGQAMLVTQPQAGEFLRFPSFLADGVHFVFTTEANNGLVSVRIGSLTDDRTTELAPVGRELTQAYVAHGMLLFSVTGKLLAIPLDETRWRVSGEPRLVATDVAGDDNKSWAFAVSDSTLVYRSAPSRLAQLTWLSSTGAPGTQFWGPGLFQSVQLSPDDQRAAADRSDGSKFAVWVLDLVRDRQLELTESAGSRILWTRNLARVLFKKPAAAFHENLYSVAADGSGGDELVADQPDDVKTLIGWSDTGSLLYGGNNASSRVDLWEKPLSRGATILLHAAPNAAFNDADVTPSGDLIASAVSGNASGLYVQRLRGGGERQQVEAGITRSPRWRADGRELFYLSGGYLKAVDVTSADPVRLGAPRTLFEFTGSAFSPSHDGQRFLAAVPRPSSAAPPSVSMILNWTSLPGR